MNKQELIKFEKERYERSFVILNCLPEDLNIEFISEENVFIKESETYEEFLSELDKFDSNEIEIDFYYISGESLAIKCLYKSFQVIFFCGEIEIALKELSGDTCEVKQKREFSISKTINCKLK